MQDLNRVQLIGHLGQDPQTKYTATGTARTTFTVATSQRWKDAAGQVQDTTDGGGVWRGGRWPRSAGSMSPKAAASTLLAGSIRCGGRMRPPANGMPASRSCSTISSCAIAGVEPAWEDPTVTRGCPFSLGVPGVDRRIAIAHDIVC